MRRITVLLPEAVADQLRRLAEADYRAPREQAGFLLADAIRHQVARLEAEAEAKRAGTAPEAGR